MIYDTFRQALQNIWSSKFRTILTMLGIIIGVMAVIVIVGLGNGMTQSMKESFSSMGTDLLTLSIRGYGQRSATYEQVTEILDASPEYFSSYSPTVNLSGSVKVDTTSYDETSVLGVNEEYLFIQGRTLAQGRALLYADMMDNKKVCVIGDYLSRTAYGGNALGQSIKVGSERYTIVGVLAAEVSDLSSQEGSSDDCIYLPYTTALRVGQQSSPSSYTIVLTDENQASAAKERLEDGLYELFLSSSGYFVTSMSETLETLTQTIDMVVLVLSAIAGISLLVGGIGIMNIMMVSVTERTREIGIRKALGAKQRYILLLFVVEAGTTSALGGLLGIGLGYLVSAAANALLPMLLTDMELTVSPSAGSVAMAFGISVGIGVLFGYLPAKRAARLNPIDALRYD